MTNICVIHAEFWRSLSIVSLDYFARLCVIGLYSMASTEGIGLWSAKALKMWAFPGDTDPDLEAKIEAAMEAIKANCDITVYEDKRGRPLYWWNNWFKWRSFNNPNLSNYADALPDNFDYDGAVQRLCVGRNKSLNYSKLFGKAPGPDKTAVFADNDADEPDDEVEADSKPKRSRTRPYNNTKNGGPVKYDFGK